jgi:hypothetical protein
MVLVKKAKLSKKQRKTLSKKYKHRRQTKKAHRGGASSCEAAYITESGFSVPDHGTIKGFTLSSKQALLRGNSSCARNHP